MCINLFYLLSLQCRLRAAHHSATLLQQSTLSHNKDICPSWTTCFYALFQRHQANQSKEDEATWLQFKFTLSDQNSIGAFSLTHLNLDVKTLVFLSGACNFCHHQKHFLLSVFNLQRLPSVFWPFHPWLYTLRFLITSIGASFEGT